MGRYLDRRASPNNYLPNSATSTPPATGRFNRMTSRDENLFSNTERLNAGRYQSRLEDEERRREEERKFLESEEGKKMIAEIQDQVIKQQQEERDKQTFESRRARERAGQTLGEETDVTRQTRATDSINFEEELMTEQDRASKEREQLMDERGGFRANSFVRALTPRVLEPKVAGDDTFQGQNYLINEARNRSREQLEADLSSLGLTEKEIKAYSGINPEIYEDVVNEVAKNPLAIQGKNKAAYYMGATIKAFTKNDYDVRLPFGSKDQVGQVRGIHSKIITEVVARGLLELVPRATVVTSANMKSVYNQLRNGQDVTEDDLSVVLPFKAERLGLTPENLGTDEEGVQRVADSGTRLFKRWAQITADNPEGNDTWNGVKAAWDTAIMDVLDVWATEEISRLTLTAMSTSQKSRLANNLQVLGYSSDEIAGMTDDVLKQTLKTKVVNRMDDILNLNAKGTVVGAPKAGTAIATAGQQGDETARLFMEMVKEGTMTASQADEAARLVNSLGNIGVVMQNGQLQAVPKIVQASNQFATGMTANLTGRAGTAGRQGEMATGIFRQRPAGMPTRPPRIGLQIEDVSGLPLPDNQRGAVEGFLQDIKSVDGFEDVKFEFDPSTASVVIPDDVLDELPDGIGIVSQAATRAGINLSTSQTVNGEPFLEEVVREFDAGIAEEIARQEASNRLRREELEEPDVSALAEGNPLSQAVADANPSQVEISQLFNEIQSSTVGRSLEGRVARELINTPPQARIQIEPIRRSALSKDNPFEAAVLNNQDNLAAGFAEIARQTTPAEFADNFGFLTNPRNQPDVEFPGSRIFGAVQDRDAILNELRALGLVSDADLNKVVQAQIPTSIVDVPSPNRLALLEEIDELENGAQFFAKDPAIEQIRQALDNAVALRRQLNTFRVPTPQQTLTALEAIEPKPQFPVFALTNDGRAVLLNQDPATRRTVAAADIGGVDTIPGLVIDYKGNLSSFQDFLKEQGLTLEQFATSARDLTPSLAPKAKGKKGDVKKLSEESGLLSGRLTKVGTSDINSVVIPTKFLRQDIPVENPVLYNGMDARDRFEIPKIEIAGIGGMTRDVYALGPDAVIKIAKAPNGIVQNIQSYNYHAITTRLIPRMFEGGENYIVTEKVMPLKRGSMASKVVQDFTDSWVQFVKENKEDFPEFQSMDPTRQEQYLFKLQMDEVIYEFMDQWRNSDAAFLGVTPEGLPLYNWDELAHYRVAIADLVKDTSWGQRADGTLVLLDEGALDVDAVNFIKYGKTEDWAKYSNKFSEAVLRVPAKKKMYKDSDPHTLYSFTPMPAFDENEEGDYEFDIWRSLALSVGVGLGMKNVGGRGRKGNQAKNLPQVTPQSPKLLPVGRAIMNADAWKAKTGQAFGAVLPRPQIPKGPQGTPTNGVRPLGSKTSVAPMGEADYAFLDKDIAYMHGKYDQFISTSDKTYVITNDNEYRELAYKAGVENTDILTGELESTKANIQKMRDYLDAEGYDGVIVRFDDINAPSDHIKFMFEYEQFISFNKSNFVRTKGSGIQKTTKGTRAKKGQRQIMEVLDPPANQSMINEKVELRRRLIELNRVIKEGKQLGAKETRVAVTNRLRNSFQIVTENMRRNQELMRLRDRIIAREKDIIKRDLVMYAKMVLPTKEGREFLAERGKLISSIATTDTRTQLYKKMIRIDQMYDEVVKKNLRNDIAKTVNSITSSKKISADYRMMARDLVSDYDFKKMTPKKRRQVAEMRKFVEREQAAGVDVEITSKMVQQMERFALTPLADMNIAELQNILSDLRVIETVGRTKFATRERLQEQLIETRKQEVLADLRTIESKALNEVASPELKLSKKERLQNFVRGIHNMAKEQDMAITPTDSLFDLMGSGYGSYSEGPYRWYKEVHDQNYRLFIKDVTRLVDRFGVIETANKLDDVNYTRIFAYMVRQQGEKTIERAVAGGMEESFIREINLSAGEMEMALFMRESLDAEVPMLRKLAFELYNKEFDAIENYFTIMADFESMGDMDLIDRFGKAVPIKTRTRRTLVKAGTLEVRDPRAAAAIRTNAKEVFLAHMDNSLYLKNMARDIEISTKIAKDPDVIEKSGDLGASFALDYMDLLARKGGADNQASVYVIDALNRNVGVAILGYKISSALIQVSAIPNGAALIGGVYAGRGLTGFATSRETRRWVMDNMPEVRETVVDDIGFLDRPSIDILAKFQDNGYLALKQLDSVSRGSIAWGAYLKYLDDNKLVFDAMKPNKKGIDYAERMTRLTQSSSMWKDAPLAISRGRGLTGNRSLNRAILKFQSFPLSAWRLLSHNAYGAARAGNYKQALNILFWRFMSTYVVEEAMRGVSQELENLITGKDEETEDGYTEKFIKLTLGQIPYVSQIASMIVYDSVPAPLYNGFQRTASGAGGVSWGAALTGQGDSSDLKSGIDLATGIGTLYGVPGMFQIRSTLRDYIDAKDGSTESGPASPSAPTPPRAPKGPSGP